MGHSKFCQGILKSVQLIFKIIVIYFFLTYDHNFKDTSCHHLLLLTVTCLSFKENVLLIMSHHPLQELSL